MNIIKPEYSVERIVARMRAAVVDQKDAGHRDIVESTGRGFALDSPSADETEIHPIELQPSFQPRADDHYHLHDLLKFNDEKFIEAAYLAILKRSPDEGSSAFLGSLRSGRLNKIDVLSRLRWSSEGREKNVTIDGLWVPATLRRFYQVPVLGYLLNVTIALVRLPSMITNHRQFEAHVLAQQELIVRQLNHVGATLTKHTRQAQVQAEALVQLEETHQTVLRRVGDLTRYLEDRVNDEAAERQADIRLLTSNADETASQVGALQRSNSELIVEAARLNQAIQSARELLAFEERRTGALKKQAVKLRADLEIYAQTVSRLAEELTSQRQSEVSPEHLRVLERAKANLLDPLYASLTEPFRGTPGAIKERLKVYLPFLSAVGSNSLIDVGSGRGEWLELVTEVGLAATGVETNTVLVQQSLQRGLRVVEDDLIDYLAAQPDNTVGGVTGFHVVEHLPIELVVQFLTEVMRVLVPGGVVILETPNPRNVLVGSCNFYFDPTHRNPIPAEILQFLMESRGFSDPQLLLLNPSSEEPLSGDSELVKRFNQYFYGPMDYGIVAWKPTSSHR
ncbi:MAG TPA: methyltransferase domain-containing protein [Pyrinomonadaceae bacterium]|nr:methyltransferase domain-containing protein [Pyrinomonadaceae bacterium]